MPPRSDPELTHRIPRSRIIAVVPVRFASTRFPGKPLADLGGRPMVEHVYRRAADARTVGSVIVATDDERIRAVVEAFGGVARLTAASHASGTDRVAEVAGGIDCEIVVNVQGDEPLIEPAMIDQAVEALLADLDLPISTLRRRIDDPAELSDPNVCKVVVDREGHALYFSRAPIPYTRHGAPEKAGGPRGSALHEPSNRGPKRPAPQYWKHIGLYAYRKPALLKLAALGPTPLERAEALEQLRALEHGLRIRAVETAHDTIGVDTPQDLERVRERLRQMV